MQEKVDDVLRSCPNVRVTCTKSGKFTTQLMQRWFSEVFLTDAKEQSMLIIDGWAGQGPTAGLSSPNLTLEYIPKGATKYIQPLDVYFFRQYKILVKNIIEQTRDSFFHDKTGLKPCDRFFIVKLHNLCFNQLQHPRFSPMLRYAWQKSGYDSDSIVESFENVFEILLKPLKSRNAKSRNHDEFPIFKCVYCDAFVCLKCLDDPIHFHDRLE